MGLLSGRISDSRMLARRVVANGEAARHRVQAVYRLSLMQG
jgi:hypothetical protein